MTLKKIIEDRRSIRKFKSDPVSKEMITDLIEVAVQAPSASNAQPWKFLVIQNRDVIQKTYLAVLEQQEKISEDLPEGTKRAFEEYGRYFVRFADAPVVIIPIYKTAQTLSRLLERETGEVNRPFSREDIRFMEEQSAVISLSLSIQNLLLYAHEQGLGASCMTGPLIANTALREILSVPSQWKIGAVIPLGYPDEKPERRGRKPAEKVIKWM